jgi:hypothetical protein
LLLSRFCFCSMTSFLCSSAFNCFWVLTPLWIFSLTNGGLLSFVLLLGWGLHVQNFLCYLIIFIKAIWNMMIVLFWYIWPQCSVTAEQVPE